MGCRTGFQFTEKHSWRQQRMAAIKEGFRQMEMLALLFLLPLDSFRNVLRK
jgi:hypothetical protein